MAFPGEAGTLFPEAYLTKVPHKTRRREERFGKADLAADGGRLPSEVDDLPAKLIIHEDEYLYFDYGAVRLGRKPESEEPDDPRPVCVGYGWLPGWKFTIGDRGLPDIVPAQHSPSSSPTTEHAQAEAAFHQSQTAFRPRSDQFIRLGISSDRTDRDIFGQSQSVLRPFDE